MAEDRAKRRLAAILAADVVGYSRLMRADEAGTLFALKARRRDVLNPLVSKLEGRVFKFTGDGVLVEFSSAVNAVQCAVYLQHAFSAANADLPDDRHIMLRIGINLGDVMVEGGDLYGDGVNVAARLEAIAEPGGILISGTAHDHVLNKIKVGFDDLGAQILKNIAEPIRAYRVTGTPATAVAEPKSATEKPSIAVLPFVNMSSDPGQQYFSDGITEDIITELSRFRSLFVIARHSSFQYRDKVVDVRRIGRELDVAYVVEGSVRKAGERVRITGQLIETATGNHVWADRFDRDLVDIFAVQDEVVQTIVSRLAVRLETEELKLARRRPPQDMRAYDLWLRGKRCLDLWTAEGNAEARRLFEQAIHIDPACARAHAGLALTREWGAWYSKWAPDGENSREMALRSARKAVALDDTDHEPHIVLAWIYHERRQFDQSRQHLDRALALNPNDADAMANRAMILTLQGEPEAGRTYVEAAIRLNPHHSDWYIGFLAACHFLSRNYSEVIRLRERLTNAFPEGQAVLAATYALAGDLQQANKTMQEFLSRYHLYWRGPPSARHFTDLMALKRREDHDFIMEGLRMAGMPE